MMKRGFPFLKCCEWLYRSALGAGILFVLFGFLQDEQLLVSAFPNAGRLLGLITAGSAAAQALFLFCEKGYRLHAALGLLIVNFAFGLFLLRQPEMRFVFLSYAALEAACIVCAAVAYAVRSFRVPCVVLVSAQAASLVISAVLKKPLPGWCVCVMLTSFLLFIAEITANGRKEVIELLPLFAAAMLLICTMPRSENPLDWSWAKGIYTAVQEKAEMLALDVAYLFDRENDFSFSSAGYGSSARLGGSVLDNDREQLCIKGSATKNPLYLTGTDYGVYTGAGWQAVKNRAWESDSLSERDGILSALEQSVYAGRQDELTSSCRISVEYRFIKTADFFHDLRTTNLYFIKSAPRFKNGVPWKMKHAKGMDFTYQLNFLEINEKSDEIKALLRQQAWRDDAVWGAALQQKQAKISETYTQLPDTLPQRVYELAHNLAANADNDYDRMTAFADYLRTFGYTTTPPEIPEDCEFTDYFLFDSKSGYCTYFATALAVLGRCEGIPTRYVNGFVTQDTCKGNYIDVAVTGDMAHAWTEAYIEHIGWVRFDATPGYTSGAATDNAWKPAQTGNTENSGKDEKPNQYERPGQEESQTEFEEKGEPLQELKEGLPEFVVMFSIGLLLAAALAVIIGKTVRRKKYMRADNAEKARLQIKRLMRLAKLKDAPLSEGETLQAYCERVHEILDAKDYSFTDACALYEEIRFGGKKASDEEISRLEAYAEKTQELCLAQCGFLKRLVYRIL